MLYLFRMQFMHWLKVSTRNGVQCIQCSGWLHYFLVFGAIASFQSGKKCSNKTSVGLQAFDFQVMTHSAVYLTTLNTHKRERQKFLLQMSLHK